MGMKMSDNIAGQLGPPVGSAAWEAVRCFDDESEPPVVIGASDVPAITGLSHYQTPLELYMVKRGLKDSEETNAAMEWGTRLEAPILEKYADVMGCAVQPAQYMILCADAPFIGATPDAYAWDEDDYATDHVLWLVECKTSSRWRYSEDPSEKDNKFGPGEDDIPREYLLQCQAQMMVTGLDRVDVPVLFDGRDFKIYTVHRHDTIIRQLKVQLKEFFRRLQEKDPPDPDLEHPTTLQLLKTMYQPEKGLEINLTFDMARHAEAYQTIQEQIKDLRARKELLQAKFLSVMKEAQIARIDGTPLVAKRTITVDSYWTEKDIEKATKSLGSVKRKGHQRFTLAKE